MQALLSHPAIEAAVRDRYDFDEADGATFDSSLAVKPPPGLTLVLNGHLTQPEADHLLKLADACDPHLGAALRALVASAPDSDNPAAITEVSASAGLEQILQVCRFTDGQKRLTLDPEKRALTWRGYFTAKEAEALRGWKGSTPFYRTVDALLDAATAARSLAFTSTTFTAPAAFPPMLHVIKGGPTGNPDEFNYKLDKDAGLLDADAWKVVKQPPEDWPAKLREALIALHTALDTLSVEIVEPEWRLRPEDSQLHVGELSSKLLLGRSFLASAGLLSRKRADVLLEQCTTQPAAAAIRRLYRRSLDAGFAGGSLRLRTRRGSCALVAATEDIQPQPL